MLIICGCIYALNDDDKHRIFREYWSNIKGLNYLSEIENAFDFFSIRGDTKKLYDSITRQQIETIFRKISDCIREDNYLFLMHLLSYLDNYLSGMDNINRFCERKASERNDTYFFNSLSEDKNGLIIPRLQSKWKKARNNSPESLNENPLSILNNYLWIPRKQGWSITNVYNPKWNWNGEKKYAIVCSSLSNVQPFHIELCKSPGQNLFYINEYKQDEQRKIEERIKKTISFANENKAEIVLFPELMISREHLEEFSGILKQHPEYSHPRIICNRAQNFWIPMDGRIKQKYWTILEKRSLPTISNMLFNMNVMTVNTLSLSFLIIGFVLCT